MPKDSVASTETIRLRRYCPVNLGIGRIVLTGLLYPTLEDLYEGAQLITVDPDTANPVVHNLQLGQTFDLGGRWILHTVLDHGDAHASAEIHRDHRQRRYRPTLVSTGAVGAEPGIT